jgi:hypothetical protein
MLQYNLCTILASLLVTVKLTDVGRHIYGGFVLVACSRIIKAMSK